MAKRDKLYTVNKWNRPFFEEERRRKLYLGGGPFDTNNGYTNGVKTNQGSLINSLGITSWGNPLADANQKTRKGITDFAAYSNPGHMMDQFLQYRYPHEATQTIQPIQQETQKQNNEDKPKSDWLTRLPDTFNRLNAAYNTYNAIESTKKALNNGSIDLSKLTTAITPAKLPDITISSGKTIAGNNLINHLGLNTDALTSQATKDAVKSASKKLVESLPQTGSTGTKFFDTSLGQGLAMTGANIAGDALRGLVRNKELGNTTAARVGDALSTIGSAVGTGLMATGYGLPIGLLATGIGKTLGMIADQFGSVKHDNGTSSYIYTLQGSNPQGSNEYLANLQATTPYGPEATYTDGIFTDSGKYWARRQNRAVAKAYEDYQRKIRNALYDNNWMQMQHAINESAIGGKINRKKCNCKADGGFLNTGINPTSAAGYDILSTYLTTQMQKNQNNQDMGSSLGNSFMGADTNTLFANGGSIHINPAHKGEFTAKAKRHGMGVQQFANHVLAHKDKFPTSTVRQAVFAKNSHTWKKAFGGKLNYGEDKDIRDDSFFNGASLYDLGGVLQAAGTNWGKATEINEGGTHEENPNEGVQVGVDPEGTPNLVEEGEVIWNDYVFSNRIKCPKEVCKLLRVGVKKNGFTFAEVAKKLLAESKERPNDPISKKGLEANMQKLEDAQEEVKQKMEAEQAVEQFNSLPPEQQVAIMQQEGSKAQDAVAQQQMAQELQNLPPEQQQAIAQQMAIEQAQAQGMPQGMPQQGPSPEEQAMMQQQMAQQQYAPQGGINPQEALSQAAAMQQQAINGSAYGGRLFADGGMIAQEQPTEQATEQADPEMAKYSDEELQDIINDYEEAANGEKKVTKGRLARLKKKAERAERELERRNSQGENAEQKQPGAAEGQPQEPTQEQIQAAAQAQAQQQMTEGQQQGGMPQEGMSPEQAMMMQQQMGGQQMSPEEMAAMELQQQGNGQYGCGGKLYLTGGELLKALGFKSTKDLPFTLKDLGINDWDDQVNPQKVQSIYGKVTDPIVKHLIKNGWNPFDSTLSNPDRWFENSAGEAINWGDAGQYKTNGYDEAVLNDMAKRYPHIKYALEHGLKNHDFSKGNVKKEDLFKALSEAPEWKETEQYLYDPDNGLARRLEYIARRRGITANDGDKDEKFLNKWNTFGDFTLGDDGRYTYTLKNGKQADFDAAFKKAREDGLIGTMYDVRVPATTKPYRYLLDENGNPTDDLLFDTTGYEQVGNPYSYYTLGKNGTFDPNINNEITYWRKKTGASDSSNETDGTTDESKYLTVGWKPKTNYTDYVFGALPGIAGLSMMLGQGKPDTSGIEAAADYYANSGAGIIVGPHLTHGLIKPAIIDPRVTHNTLNTSRLGTNRLLRNTGSAPNQAAAILANDVNYQNQMGQNDLRDWLANREQEQKAAQFNRETATTNANILNATDQFNAQMLANRAEKSAQLRYNAAKEKLDQDNAYRAGLLGNMGSIFTGLNEARKQQNINNQRDLLLASGVFGETNPFLENYYGISKVDPDTGKVVRGYNTGWYYRINPQTSKPEYSKTPFLATPTIQAACGGKLKKNKRRGYTY